jgi:hypothetical protein
LKQENIRKQEARKYVTESVAKEREGRRGGGRGRRYPRNRLNQQTYLQLDPQVQADPQEHFAFPQPDMMMMMMVERVSTKKKYQEAIDHTHREALTKTNERGARETRRQRKRCRTIEPKEKEECRVRIGVLQFYKCAPHPVYKFFNLFILVFFSGVCCHSGGRCYCHARQLLTILNKSHGLLSRTPFPIGWFFFKT